MMRTLLMLGLLAAAARAQEWLPEYNRHLRAGIEHHLDGRYDEAIASFERCLELSPRTSGCAYNIACGRARQNQIDQAFEWLAKAGDWGFAYSDGRLELAQSDSDLDNLRKDPRFEQFLERLRAQIAAADAYSSEYGSFVPPALAGEPALPLLVVLHDFGETRESALAQWKPIAEELGTALVVPSARVPIAGKPAEGMSWFDDVSEYQVRYDYFEQPINRAVKAFAEERALDPARVFIAGTGQGGLVAFNAAVFGPGRYRGVLVLDGPLLEGLAQPKLADAAKSGLKVRVLALGEKLWGGAGLDVGAWCEALSKRMADDWELADSSVRYHGGTPFDAAQRRAAIVEALKSLQPAIAAGAER